MIGDLVEVDAANVLALARIRSIDGERMHLALEQGGFVPWIEDAVHVRRLGPTQASWDARLTYAGASTITLEVLGPTPGFVSSVPEPLDTERDVGAA